MATYQFENNAESELTSEIGASDVTLNVTTGDGALFPSSGNFYVFVEEGSTTEWMLCTARSSDALTVTRASSASSFSAGATVKLRLNATILDVFLQKGVYRTNAGSPNGSLAASYTGEEVLDSTNSIWYKHISGTTWKAMTT